MQAEILVINDDTCVASIYDLDATSPDDFDDIDADHLSEAETRLPHIHMEW